jgi:hypothetical protein
VCERRGYCGGSKMSEKHVYCGADSEYCSGAEEAGSGWEIASLE